MLTSTHNPKIQLVRALNASAKKRREESAFVVEGVRLAEEAVQAGWPARFALTSDGLSERGHALATALTANGVSVETVAPELFAAICDTETPQGILLTLHFQPLPLPNPLRNILIADGVRDPGNLGALLRAAAAAGVQAALLAPGTVDAFNPKVLRAAMGAHFRLPLRALAWPALAALLQTGEPPAAVYIADAEGELDYAAVDWRQPFALVVGGEAEGASPQARQHAAGRVFIPMAAGTESLNAAMAAGVILFEAARQRRD